jgi:hypothetical protein
MKNSVKTASLIAITAMVAAIEPKAACIILFLGALTF